MDRILIVEADSTSRAQLAERLMAEGYQVTLAEAPDQMFSALEQRQDYAAVVGDLGRLETDAAPLLHRLAQQYSLTPVIVTLSEASAGAVSYGLRAGVFDVFIKPFVPEALLLSLRNAVQVWQLRLRAQLLQDTAATTAAYPPVSHPPSGDYHHPLSSNGCVTFGSLRLDRQRRLAACHGTPLELTPTEFDILLLLARHAGQVMLFQDMVYWLHHVQVSRTEARQLLSAHMSNLRTKLRKVGCAGYLVNSRGRGYSLDCGGDPIALDTALEAATVPGIFWSTDRQLRFVKIWGGRLHVLKVKIENLVGRSLYELTPIDAAINVGVQAHLRALSGENVTYEMSWLNQRFWSRVEPIYDHERQIIGCAGACVDVEETTG